MAEELSAISVAFGADIAAFEAGVAKIQADLNQVAAAAATASGRYVDAQGKMRESNGRFVSASTLAAEAAGKLGGSLGNLSDVTGRAAQSINGGLVSSFAAFDKAVRPLNEGVGRLGEGLKSVGGSLSTYLTLPLVGAGVAALKVGGDFQAAFNRVQAATQASGAELDALRQKAQGIALDPNLKFSSVEAAQALENLAKNGLSATQILSGAADASTALATATGSTLATAADITTDVMNNFGKSADQAAGLVSNITGATIASKFSIDDYRLALGQAGAIAGQLGVNFEDFNTALSVTSSGFSSGQDAGTSFKTFLQRLVPQSKEAEAAIKQLGLNFFDTQGKMLPLRDIAGQLQQAFNGLSDQAKNTQGTKIFGSDSIRTALLLAKDGVAGFDEMAASIAKVNAASQGQILSQGFVGSFEAFKSSLEGLGQAIADSGLLDFATNLAKQGAKLASSLAQADPELLRFGVGIGVAVAAIGPLLVGIGTLGAALPAIATGFALLTGPVGIAAAAVAALTVGIVALIAVSSTAGESVAAVSTRLGNQQSAVQGLQATYLPLLARYDALKAKSKLSAEEQEELRAIIGKVGTQIPTTVTQFDAYGKALDINSAAAKGFIQRQQEIAQQANKVELSKQREEYGKLTQQIRGVQNALNEVDANGVHVKVYFDEGGGGFQALTSKEITDLQARLESLSASRRGVGGLIDQLKGIPPVIREATKEVDYFSDELTTKGVVAAAGLSDAMAKALAKVHAELALNDNLSRALGDSYDYVGGRSKALESGIKSLVAAGFSPMGSTVQQLVKDMRGLAVAIDTLPTRQLKGADKIGKIPDFELKLPKKQELPTDLLPNYEAIFARAAQQVADGGRLVNQHLSEAQLTALTTATSFNTGLETALVGGLQNVADGVGAAVGNILSGTAGLNDLGAAILGPIGDVAIQVGQLAVGVGIATIGIKAALESLNPVLAIAGGIALIALGSAVKGAAKRIAGGGGGAGAASSIASAPRTPTAPPAATAPPPAPVTITHEVRVVQRGADLVGALQIQQTRNGRVVGTGG